MSVKRTASVRESQENEGGFSQVTDHGEGTSQESITWKRPRKEGSKNDVVEYTGPTNKVLPVQIEFPPKLPGTMRLAAWNVSGLVACEKKGFKHYLAAEDPDILIITETKVNQAPITPALKERFPHQYWSISAKKGYSGTAILSKHKPLGVQTTLPGHPDPGDVKGRIITLEFKTCYVVGTYVVNAGQKLKTLDAKKTWNQHFFAYLNHLDKQKPVIWGGDFNVAPTELDLAHPKANWNKTAGYTEAETTAFRNFLNPPKKNAGDGGGDDSKNGKFVDLWRDLHPGERGYTYFSYRFNCRMKGIGWRIDGFVVSDRLKESIKICDIRGEIYGASDHLPVVLEIEREF